MAENALPRLFVSHHSSKSEVAQQAEALLAKRGIRCWIAPRDVPPGAPFDSAIQKAINESAAVLLLFCANSDKSRHVKRELILGDSAGRPIIPLRLEAIDPGELAYHLADSQWIDWIDRREAVMDRVAAQVRLYAGAPAALAEDVTALGSAAGIDHSDAAQNKWAIPALIGALAIALVFVAVLAMRGTDDTIDESDIIASADTVAVDTGPADSAVSTPTATEEPDAEPDRPPPSQADRPSRFTAPAASTPAPSRPERAPPQVATVPASNEPLRRVVQGCAGAATDTEYLICAHPELDARARRMGELLTQLRTAVQDNGRNLSSFNSDQRQWFNTVKAECSSLSCVESRQVARIAELERLLSRFQ